MFLEYSKGKNINVLKILKWDGQKSVISELAIFDLLDSLHWRSLLHEMHSYRLIFDGERTRTVARTINHPGGRLIFFSILPKNLYVLKLGKFQFFFSAYINIMVAKSV